MNKWHDAKIPEREFCVGDEVLLFKSRLKPFTGKFKSKKPGLFIVTNVYPSRASE